MKKFLIVGIGNIGNEYDDSLSILFLKNLKKVSQQ